MTTGIKWNISGGLVFFDRIIEYNSYLQDFYNVEFNFVGSVFDSVYGMKWNSGRVLPSHAGISLEEAIKRVKFYNSMGIGFNFTFSNSLVEEEDLNDKYCNLLLKECCNELNGVILNSELLNEYIRNNYPTYKRICSATKNIRTIEEYNRACDNYDIVVLSPDFNHDLNFINEINNKDKLEIIVNEACVNNCPFRNAHYLRIDKINKNIINRPFYLTDEEMEKSGCMAMKHGYIKDEANILGFFEIDKLKEMGIDKFKLVGREFTWERYFDDLKAFVEQKWIQKILIDGKCRYEF